MPHITKKQRQAQETRTKLVEAARECFLLYGFKKCTMKQIIEKAAVGYGTAYVYFNNKDELFVELIDTIMVDLIAIAKEPFQPTSIQEAYTLIEQQTTGFLAAGIAEKNIFLVIEEALKASAIVKAKWQVVQRTFISQIQQDITFAQQQGLVHPVLSAKLTAHAWYMLNESMLWAMLADDSLQLEEVATTIHTIYRQGIYLKYSPKNQ